MLIALLVFKTEVFIRLAGILCPSIIYCYILIKAVLREHVHLRYVFLR